VNRIERGKKSALKAAQRSSFYAHRVGAALFLGARLVSIGWNQHKTHPECNCYTQHAEFAAICRSRKKLPELSKVTLYVARLTRTDRVSYSRPCPHCQRALLESGITKVYYTDYDGEMSLLVFDDVLDQVGLQV